MAQKDPYEVLGVSKDAKSKRLIENFQRNITLI